MLFKKIKSLIAFAFIVASLEISAVVPCKVLICGTCKNVEPFLQNDFQNIEALGNHFEDYFAVISENNSSDNTPSILKNWAKNNSRAMVISEHLTRDQLLEGALCFDKDENPSRMENIARARNRLLEVVRQSQFDDYDFVIMADLDFRHGWPINEIVRTIRDKGDQDWDCVTANGISGRSYYDRYAFRDNSFPFGPELLGEPWWQNLGRTPIQFQGDKWVPVYSAFGGLAIYKRNSLIESSYYGYVTDDLTEVVKTCLISLGKNHPEVQKYLRTISYDSSLPLEDAPIIFQCNSGYHNFPTCCEHVTLHASMILRGHGKIFINPEMVMMY